MTATKTATASSNNASAKQLDWSTADDSTLVQGAVARDAGAWREFMSRHRSTLDKKIKFTLGRYSSRLRSNDTVDDIRAEVYEQLLSNNMGRLRAFDEQKGTFTGWLSMIAQQTTQRHLHRVMQRPLPDPIESLIEQEEDGSTEGANWVAHGEDDFLELLDFKRFAEKAKPTMAPDKVVKKYLAKRGG